MNRTSAILTCLGIGTFIMAASLLSLAVYFEDWACGIFAGLAFFSGACELALAVILNERGKVPGEATPKAQLNSWILNTTR